jgi:uncharacterized protein YqgC (DUF456 family)
MKKMINKTIKKTLGVLLIIIGIAGLFLPILQGVAMIIFGISLVHPILYKKIIKKLKKFYHRIRTNET